MVKTQLVIFIILITAIFFKVNGQVNNDLEKENLLGKVKVTDEYLYEDIDASGKIIDELSFTRNINKFDNIGNYIEKKRIIDDRFWISKYFYDSKQKWIKKIRSEKDTLFYYYEECNYDKQGNLTEWQCNVVWNKIDNNDTTFRDKTTNKYDIEGQLRSKNLWNGEQIFTSTFYYYDNKGEQITEVEYYKGSYSAKKNSRFNERNQLIELYEYANDSSRVSDKYTFKYDNNGNLIQKEKYDSRGILDYTWTFKYDYDKIGNWIKCTCIGNSPLYIKKRKIEYYE